MQNQPAVTITERIPRERFNLWYELFKCSSGRILYGPNDGLMIPGDILVVYSFDDEGGYKKFKELYRRTTTPIIESRRGFWKKLRKRLDFRIN